MTATIQPAFASEEDLQKAIRDLESKAAELEVKKHALEAQLAELQAHPPRLFKGKHRDKVQDLRIDMKYLDSQIAKIASDRARYLDSLSSEVERTESEPEVSRQELAELDTESPAFVAPAPRETADTRVTSGRRDAVEHRDLGAFYRETMRPALLALMDARRCEDRLAFLDGYKKVTGYLG